jgi:hypothetical protein
MTAAAEFFTGVPSAPVCVAGPSRWPYLSSERRVAGCWQPVLEPSVPVLLLGPWNWCRTVALLDSGADRTAIPYEWAEPFGVDLLGTAKRQNAWGNGVLAEYFTPKESFRLELAGRVIDVEPLFTPWEHLVLGRDVFRHFQVLFDERAHETILLPYDEDAR